jgi:branched-chain amino acid transport system ATP-binding protein
MSGALLIDHLSVSYHGRSAVSDVTLSVPGGEVTALLGANGAGKSSLVKALAGAVPSAGRLMLDERPLPARPQAIRRAGVAVVPEGHRVFGELTVADNLRVATAVLHRGEREAATQAALDLFPELARMLTRSAGLLSGGEQQMLALAQALVARPRFILIDELSLGLAPVVVRRLADALARIAARGVGILLIEQFTSVALALARRAYVMARGRLSFEGDAAELAARPDLLHAAYLGSGEPFEPDRSNGAANAEPPAVASAVPFTGSSNRRRA